MNHLSSTFPGPRGTRLRYQYWEESAKGHARVALLLHGQGRHTGSYPDLVPALLRERYKAYALDFAGFGASPGERGDGGAVAMADTVEALYRRIESAEGAREIDIIAHSMGAVAAFLFLKRYPARRARIAALAPLFFGAPARDIPDTLATDLDAAVAALLADPSFLEGRTAAFFVGEADPLVPLDRLKAAIEGLPLKEKRLVSFPGELRDPFAGRGADQVAGAVISWLAEAGRERSAP